jgi:hypothetical protein
MLGVLGGCTPTRPPSRAEDEPRALRASLLRVLGVLGGCTPTRPPSRAEDEPRALRRNWEYFPNLTWFGPLGILSQLRPPAQSAVFGGVWTRGRVQH